MIHLPYVAHIRMVDQRLNHLHEVSTVFLRQRLAREYDRQTGFFRDSDRLEWPLSRRHSPQVGQIPAGQCGELIGVEIAPIVDDANAPPPLLRYVGNLSPTDCRNWSVCISAKYPDTVGSNRIMQRVQDGNLGKRTEGNRKGVQMEVNHVKCATFLDRL